MHPDIEAALAEWWVAEQLVRAVPWTDFPAGDRRTQLHTKTRKDEQAARDTLFNAIERRQGTTIKPPPPKPTPPAPPSDDGGPGDGVRRPA
jgi:hypothetical protein